jgi:hypothetical protein
MLNLGSPKLKPLPIKSRGQEMGIKVNLSWNKCQVLPTSGVAAGPHDEITLSLAT